jgi:hypothetical protein
MGERSDEEGLRGVEFASRDAQRWGFTLPRRRLRDRVYKLISRSTIEAKVSTSPTVLYTFGVTRRPVYSS